MFRRPRIQINSSLDSSPKPSTGRAPTPPASTPKQSMYSIETSTSATVPRPSLGKSLSASRGVVGSRSTVNKMKGKANGSILSFFKKADPSTLTTTPPKQDEDSLFFEEKSEEGPKSGPVQVPTPPEEQGYLDDDEEMRYNESPHAFKRRRTDEVEGITSADELGGMMLAGSAMVLFPSPNLGSQSAFRKENRSSSGSESADASQITPIDPCESGPFMDDAESDDEMIKNMKLAAFGDGKLANGSPSTISVTVVPKDSIEEAVDEHRNDDAQLIPSLRRESTSIIGGDGFDGIEDFIDDEFPEDGEEYMERLWMDYERRTELGMDEEEEEDEFAIKQEPGVGSVEGLDTARSEAGSCPICSASLDGISSDVASIHVNNCLDGKPTSLPKLEPITKTEGDRPDIKVPSHKRFQRAAIARPGQQNPFTFGGTPQANSSAFSKLMSSHAEDTAWANAAAAEMAARGKPAFQRTCPFYKIMPGFFICVDAFRYGAVEGCNAYFLSHFHSDHYIGLTSSWCHGPIYCSHVTANLVRRQLRVDPKWVVDLEFGQRFEVPGTEGVNVTMIPANHCPGSSLYLFEKTIGKGRTPKVQRVLHCGDFRACPAHVQHPLLRPDVIDTVTGKSLGQQKLDVCYLDTTYLTPKYAFPSQEEVIKACADMCVSLSKARIDETDDWEQTKKDRAGSGMVKFVRKNSDLIKEEENEDDIDAMKVNRKSGTKARGRLLVICGTYSIGKERICLGIAKALDSKIYAPPNKQKICAALEDPELMARMTDDPLEAQVHMQMLMEIRAETLADYLTGYKPHFSRIVGFRPSGWNYRPPNSRFVESPAVQTVLHSDNWKSRYSMAELVPQRGSTREASCFGVPYSEHSSFRELTMFCCALRIDKIIPTVNVGSTKSREKMKAWCEKWAIEKKKNGLFKVADDLTSW